MTKSTALTDVISTEAKIAMPEMVAIFLSKYETDLHEKKAELTRIIKDIKKEIENHTKATEDSVNFDEYNKMGIKELDIVCIIEDKDIDWENSKVTCTARVKRKQDKTNHDSYYSRDLTIPLNKHIRKSFITKYEALIKDLNQRKDELTVIISQITDMSRKERQIKGRISEMRLKEQGLEKFINSPDMLKLIKID